MAKIGEIDLNTESGWQTIGVYDTSDVNSPLEVYTPSGWGCLPVVDPSQADTPLEVYTQSGWKGIATTAGPTWSIVDNFEDGGLGEYQQASSASISTNRTWNGTRALRCNSFVDMYSTSGLSNYPRVGTTFEYYFNLNNMGSPELWYGTTNGTNGDSNHYQIEWFTNNTFQVRVYDGNNSYKPDSTSFDLNADTWYRVQVEWRLNGSHTHTIRLENANTGALKGQLQFNDTAHNDPLVGFGADDNMDVYFDYVRVLD